MTMILKRLVYLSNNRLPTEKAHGYQISKMCEAFAQQDWEVFLLHSYRRQVAPQLIKTSVFSYYDVRPTFQVRTLYNWDLINILNWLPTFLYQLLVYAGYHVWACYATRQAVKYNAQLYYTRSIEIAYWLTRYKVPVILELHSMPARFGLKILKSLEAQAPLLKLVALTTHIKTRLVKLGYLDQRIIVEPDAVDLEKFNNALDKQTARKKLKLPPKKTIIGHIGRLTQKGLDKGVDNLIKAYAIVHAVRSEVVLLCVGGPPKAIQKYRTLARSLGLSSDQVYLLDRVPNNQVPSWIAACDLLTMPLPWNEHFAYYVSPLKLFEYMASQQVIVASDLPSLKDVLEHERNSLLAKPGDASALANQLLRLINNPQLGLRLASQAHADVLRFTWAKRANRILLFASSTRSPTLEASD